MGLRDFPCFFRTTRETEALTYRWPAGGRAQDLCLWGVGAERRSRRGRGERALLSLAVDTSLKSRPDKSAVALSRNATWRKETGEGEGQQRQGTG
eukprot:scaffold1524_cov200-Pinguiococcus_pyrenoidosus.AAC.2